jgi:MATE family multidrug resistance protein
MLALAAPVVLGQLGMMLMSLVDTAMVGRLGSEAIGTVGIGSALYAAVFVPGVGLLLGLDRVVSVAFGAGRRDECQRGFVQGLWLATAAAVPLTLAMLVLAEHLDWIVSSEATARASAGYVRAIAWSVWPSLLFVAMRQTLQAMDDAIVPSVIVLVANLVNVGANEVLIFGALGAPALGTDGAGWATCVSRVFLVVMLAGYVWWRGIGEEGVRPDWRPHPARLRELVGLGLGAAGHLLLEVGVFSLATMMVERLGTAALAAHQIVLQVASLTFMVPLGLSLAGAVRVGQAYGQGEPGTARWRGWTAVGLGVGFMGLSAATLVAARQPILSLFGPTDEVRAIAAALLLCAGFFQLVDGAQVTLAGVLRGAGDTRSSLYANLAGHWLVGLPIGSALCFGLGLGAPGLWIGLAAGLASVALSLGVVWARRSRAALAERTTAVEPAA